MIRRKEGFQGECAIVLPSAIVRQMEEDALCGSLHITDIGYYPAAKYHFRERPQPISQYVLIYCTRGAGWYELAGRRHPVASDQLFVLPAGVPHAYGADPDDPWTIYWVHFKGSMAPLFAEGLSTPRTIACGTGSRISARLKIFEEIYGILRNGYSTDNLNAATAAFYHFLGTIRFPSNYLRADERPTTRPDVVEEAIHFMRENLGRRLTLADIARHVRYSASHFSAVFTRKTGYAPIGYFNQLKIQQACAYLDFSDLKISQICHKLGIDDPYYFSRLFSRQMGMSPSEYKKYKKG